MLLIFEVPKLENFLYHLVGTSKMFPLSSRFSSKKNVGNRSSTLVKPTASLNLLSSFRTESPKLVGQFSFRGVLNFAETQAAGFFCNSGISKRAREAKRQSPWSLLLEDCIPRFRGRACKVHVNVFGVSIFFKHHGGEVLTPT